MKGSTLITGLRRAAGSFIQSTAPRISPSALRIPTARHSTASFSTSISRRAEFLEDEQKVNAAPEIDFDGQDDYHKALMKRVRVVPASPSYFTGRPRFTDDFLELQALVRRYETYPQIDPLLAPRVAWKSLDEYQSMGTPESIRISRWRRLQQLLQRLNYIHPTVMPEEVTQVLERYKRPINPYSREPAPKVLDEMGRGKGVGRRKTCSAVAWLVEGDGEVLVNSKPLHEAFHRLHDRESALWALKATNRLSNYNLFAIVRGGGTTGWAEALTVAVARALLAHEPGLKTVLRRGRPYNPERNLSSLCFVRTQGTRLAIVSHCIAHAQPYVRLTSQFPTPRSPYSKQEILHKGRRLTIGFSNSWMHHGGPSPGREEEAWPYQGSQDARLGQALRGLGSRMLVVVQCEAAAHGVRFKAAVKSGVGHVKISCSAEWRIASREQPLLTAMDAVVVPRMLRV
ncbi:hypothetical protein HDK90DRAFT_487241 [Phyllosticta capitalensis]|uniref:Uncharacterized protein n=1 Tax=Phyllosticta capitalensis TaxID=121624 RepID=A0ABR1YMX3_9PEZI